MKEENVLTEVPKSQRQGWIAVMFIWIGSMICLPSLMVGATLVTQQNFIMAISAGIIGYVLILIITTLQGIESTDLGRPTVVVAKATYGEQGSRYVFSLIIAIALIGWFGIQANIAGETLQQIFINVFQINVSLALCSLVIGILMLITAVYGFKMMEYLNYISVPLMIFVLMLAFINAVQANDISTLFAYEPAQSGNFAASIGIVVGSFIVGAVIAGDFTRYNKTRLDTIKSAGFGIVPAGILLIIMGAVLTIYTQEDDLTSILLEYVSSAALVYVMLLLATWTTNVTNAYSAGLAIVNGLQIDDKYRKMATVISGLLGTFLAVIGVLNYFVSFLTILTNLVTPIAGVMIADYWIKYKGNKEAFINKKPLAKYAIISWIIGCIPGLIVTQPFNFFIPDVIKTNNLVIGLSYFIGIFISMGVYLLLTAKEENNGTN